MIRALHTANAVRTAKKNRKKTNAGTNAGQKANNNGDVKLVNGLPVDYPRTTSGVDKNKHPIGTLVPACGNQKAFRLWTRPQIKTGEIRFQVSKNQLRKMRKVAQDSTNSWSVPAWAEGKPGINTVSKTKAQHGSQSSHVAGGGYGGYGGGYGGQTRACMPVEAFANRYDVGMGFIGKDFQK